MDSHLLDSHIVLCALAGTIRWRIAPTRTQAVNLTAKALLALTTKNPLAVNAVPAISSAYAFLQFPCSLGNHAQFNCSGPKQAEATMD